MLEFYFNQKERICKNSPQFKLQVEEVCDSKAKEPTTLLTAKDRSKTFCGNFDIKTSLKDKIILPKNNPLHDFKALNSNANNK